MIHKFLGCSTHVCMLQLRSLCSRTLYVQVLVHFLDKTSRNFSVLLAFGEADGQLDEEGILHLKWKLPGVCWLYTVLIACYASIDTHLNFSCFPCHRVCTFLLCKLHHTFPLTGHLSRLSQQVHVTRFVRTRYTLDTKPKNKIDFYWMAAWKFAESVIFCSVSIVLYDMQYRCCSGSHKLGRNYPVMCICGNVIHSGKWKLVKFRF